ncbi:hypothetical protein HYX16_05630 [Candidatus Woesearchaeota archaeon]|nr:hypothetical protein [Candidatus Woesearchaeota archaeon]
MTIQVITKSHGGIVAGYYASFIEFSSFGDYSFPTKHFCELVQFLAKNPEIKKGKFLVYDKHKFWTKFNENLVDLLTEIMEQEDSFLPELDSWKEREEKGQPSLEDEVDLLNERKPISIEISEDYKEVIFGQYKVEPIHFSRFALYLAKGGWPGWMEREPEYARLTSEEIKKSKNPLFLDIQHELKK